MKWVTVSDMYNNAKVAEAKLLSTFNADFWTEYKNHSEYYDRLFGRMFGSFRFFDQQPRAFYEDISIADITQVRLDFTDAVYDHLLINSKKYDELYRVSQLSDANYPITTNYDITETKEETISKEGEEVSGERTDTSSTTHGAYEDSVTSVHGARTDSKSDTIGQRIDSKSDTIGGRTDSKSDTLGQHTDEVTRAYAQRVDQTDETLGQRSDSHSVTQGAQSNSRETGIAGFNSNTYSDDTNMSEQLGSRSDSSTDTIGQQINGKEVTYGAHQDVDTTVHGSQSNSSSMTTGAQSNSSSMTTGSQSNSSSMTTGAQTDTVTDTKASRSVSGSDVKGEQTDTFEHSISDEYTLRKVGNIGVKTVSEMLGEHIDLWTSYEFYRYIFKEICADLLLI